MTEDPEVRGYRPTRLWGQLQLQSVSISNGDERWPVGLPGVRGKAWQSSITTRLKMVMLPTYWLKVLGVCSKRSAIPTVITRVLTGQVVRDVAIRSIGAQPLLLVWTYQSDKSTSGAAAFFFPASTNMTTYGVYWAAISRVNPCTANGSTIWETQCSTRPWPVTAALT